MRFHLTPLLTVFFLLAFVSSSISCRADAPVQDIFLGSGTPGPFALSWNNLPMNSETVEVNHWTQVRGLDYTLDTAAGTLLFTHSLPTGSAVEVTYTTLPGQSQRTGTGQTIPLTVDLMRDTHSYFSLDALGKTAGSDDALTLGAGFGWHGGANSQLSSRFVYTPMTASTAASSDRTGVSLSGTVGAGRWGLFSAGFSRAGDGLEAGADSTLETGRQSFTLGGTLTPTKMVQAKLSFIQSEATDSTGPASAGAETSTSLALTVTPTDKTKVQAALTQAGAGQSGTTQTAALSVNTQAAKTVNVSAAYSDQNAPGTAGDSQNITLKTVLTPSKTYSVQTSANQSRLGTSTTDQQSVTLALTPKPALQLNAGFALRQTSDSGSPLTTDTSEASIGGTLHPLSNVEVSGIYKSRLAPAADTNPNDLFDTSTAQVSFTPLKTVKLIGTYAQNPDNGTDTLQRLAQHGVSLQTSVGALGLSGGCDWSRTYGTPDVEQTVHAALGLRFSAATQLSVGYQTQQNLLDPEAPLATAYTVGFTHTLGDRFSLSLSGKRQQAATTAASPDYNATASLGMKF